MQVIDSMKAKRPLCFGSFLDLLGDASRRELRCDFMARKDDVKAAFQVQHMVTLSVSALPPLGTYNTEVATRLILLLLSLMLANAFAALKHRDATLL